MIKEILSKLATNVSTDVLIKATRQNLLLPFYHLVNDENPAHTRHLYKIRNCKRFEADLDFFLKYYHPISHQELIEFKKTPEEIIPSFFLSFDDGFSEIYDVVAPILERKGVPATFFLNPSFIDNKELFFRNKASILIDRLKETTIEDKKELSVYLKAPKPTYQDIRNSILKVDYSNRTILDKLAEIIDLDFGEYLLETKPYLTSGQIQSLLKRGFGIGAHSLDHPEYQYISLKEQLYQTKESVRFLVEKFNLDYKIFSFPFTDYGVSKQFFNSIFEESKILDLSFGTAGLKKDIVDQNLQRTPMEGTNHSCKSLINAEYLYYLLKMPFRKNLIVRD